MAETTKLLCENIQNAVFGYTQSDEISILLNDWKMFNTDQWFSGKIQKIVSVAASMATGFFNKEMILRSDRMAFFDARVFSLPKEEVVNYVLWRLRDCERNSVQMLGRAYFSHKELHKKNAGNIQDMLFTKEGVNWNELADWKKRGSISIRENGNWIRKDSPIFDPEYKKQIEILLNSEE
jgi:tRNA(His) 5'-end guanylyltransferase